MIDISFHFDVVFLESVGLPFILRFKVIVLVYIVEVSKVVI